MGDVVGDVVGAAVGDVVGDVVGAVVGDCVGEVVGDSVQSGRSAVGELVTAVLPRGLMAVLLMPMPGEELSDCVGATVGWPVGDVVGA